MSYAETEKHEKRQIAKNAKCKFCTMLWISVKERLPENGQVVLVALKDCKTIVQVVRYEDLFIDERGEFFEPITNEYHNYNTNKPITHWMPQPALPSADSEAEFTTEAE